MKLDIEQIKSITSGAVRVIEDENGINFYRFTAEQEEFYRVRREKFYKKTFAPSGVQLRFKTDSENLFIKCLSMLVNETRIFFSIDVFVNGEMIGALKNFENLYDKNNLRLGEFSKNFDLGKGEKEVRICLPWSVKCVIQEFSLDDNARVEPVKLAKKILCFGDSITQGYDCYYTSNKYTTQMAEFLGAEEYNKAIGGEVFLPALAALKDDFEPDYISVAYGTNDWSSRTVLAIEENCRGFYKTLAELYPNAKIFALAPIWRKDMYTEKPSGDFLAIKDKIEKATADLENVTVISCFDFIPQDENLFSDRYLHPNDDGFAYYSKALCEALEKYI